jgi:hypothetical protein
VWCSEQGIEFSKYGSWTLESEESERGAEPDECYVFGEVAEPTRPDLAIEVVWTSGGIDKLEVTESSAFGRSGTGGEERFSPNALRGERYEAIPASEVLPGIDLLLLAGFLDRRPRAGPSASIAWR